MYLKFFIATAICSLLAFIAGMNFASPRLPLTDELLDIKSSLSEDTAHQTLVPKQDTNTTLKADEVEKSPAIDEIEKSLAANSAGVLAENARLKEKVEALELALNTIKADTTERLLKIQNDLTEAEMLLDENGLSVKKVSANDLKGILPSVFAENLQFSPGLMSKALEHSKEQHDFAWGADMQQRISDYFITHPLSNGITLDSVRCKTQTCEIRGFETQDDSYLKIMEDLSQESWWKHLGSSSSASGYPTEQGRMFYMIKKKSF